MELHELKWLSVLDGDGHHHHAIFRVRRGVDLKQAVRQAAREYLAEHPEEETVTWFDALSRFSDKWETHGFRHLVLPEVHVDQLEPVAGIT